MRVLLTTLGCKLNLAESESVARQLVSAGHTVVSDLESADLQVVNSCTVTHVAARDTRKAVRRGRRAGVPTVVAGCWVDGDPRAAEEIGAELVVPNHLKAELPALIESTFGAAASTGGTPCGPMPLGHTRAMVKVDDGCSMGCAFCIIPHVRGPQRSRPLQEVLDEVALLVAAGVPEVVLTGVQISSWREGPLRLVDLVREVLSSTGARRLRLSSLAPWRFDERLLELWSDGRVCRHVHLSLQSGCDATLQRMRRPYTVGEYAELVARIRRAIPGVAITSDVIVGFPGETEEDFDESLQRVRELELAKVHVFRFSPRPGTEAASLEGAVGSQTIARRMGQMLEIAADNERRFHERLVGSTVEVLWEERRNGMWRGLTDTYIRVLRAVGTDDLRGSTSLVYIVDTSEEGLIAV